MSIAQNVGCWLIVDNFTLSLSAGVPLGCGVLGLWSSGSALGSGMLVGLGPGALGHCSLDWGVVLDV